MNASVELHENRKRREMLPTSEEINKDVEDILRKGGAYESLSV